MADQPDDPSDASLIHSHDPLAHQSGGQLRAPGSVHPAIAESWGLIQRPERPWPIATSLSPKPPVRRPARGAQPPRYEGQRLLQVFVRKCFVGRVRVQVLRRMERAAAALSTSDSGAARRVVQFGEHLLRLVMIAAHVPGAFRGHRRAKKQVSQAQFRHRQRVKGLVWKRRPRRARTAGERLEHAAEIRQRVWAANGERGGSLPVARGAAYQGVVEEVAESMALLWPMLDHRRRAQVLRLAFAALRR